MTYERLRSATLTLILTISALLATTVDCCADDLEISWWSVDGGGDIQTTGGDLELSGTIGQSDVETMSGGEFTIAGGFWSGSPPTAPPCPADITGDDLVDVLDLLEVLSQWGGSGTADITGDGVVDVLDLLEVLSGWGEC